VIGGGWPWAGGEGIWSLAQSTTLGSGGALAGWRPGWQGRNRARRRVVRPQGQRLGGGLLLSGCLGATLLGVGSWQREVQCKCSVDGGSAAQGYGLASGTRAAGWPGS
jgi:hypothetical protein